jgi:hypothetical protein
MTCIFCKEPADASRVEHILPESLGGKGWACLPEGLVCAKCNQYFGSKVEAPALGSYPFLPFRLLLGIPTKHRKATFMQSTLGTLRSCPTPGIIGLDPSSSALEIRLGEITQVRILAEPTEPLAVCRLLLKMGVEVIARDNPSDARSTRYDAARAFARSPQTIQHWWFLIACDHSRLFARFKDGVSKADWGNGVSLSTIDIGGAEMFHLRLLEMSLFTPLEPAIYPAPDLGKNEPEWQLYEVNGGRPR